MKSAPSNSPLDLFILETLKGFDSKNIQPDWEDMEQLLGTERKPVSIKVDKKIILVSSSALLIAAGVFFLIRHFSSARSDREETINSSDTVTAIHPESTTSANVSPNQVITKADSIQKRDSILASKSKYPADTSSAKNSGKENSSAQTIIPSDVKVDTPKENNKKKSKLSSLAPTVKDSGTIIENIIPPDTSHSAHPNVPPKEELKTNSDSTKNASGGKRNRKNKKQKKSADDNSNQVKPDSLK
ncbi:MAG TPA: hypothetical protein VII99_06920 [Bacteroidia bacterium]